jgi:hypothetical protein
MLHMVERQHREPIVFLGGGLFAGLAALAIAQRNLDTPVCLIDETRVLADEVITPVYESAIPVALKSFLEPLIVKKWNNYYTSRIDDIEFHNGQVLLVAPQQILAELYLNVPTTKIYEHAQISRVTPKSVSLRTGEEIPAGLIIDLRDQYDTKMPRPGLCNAVESDYLLDASHGLEHPVMIDTSISRSQTDCQFSQYIPLDERFLRVITLTTSGIVAAQNEQNVAPGNANVISVSRRTSTFVLTASPRGELQPFPDLGDLGLHRCMLLIEAARLAIELADDIAKGNIDPTRYAANVIGEPATTDGSILYARSQIQE